MKIEMVWMANTTVIVKSTEGQRPEYFNHSCQAFMPSPCQASHYRSRRLAESVWHRQILAQEAKPMPPQADGTLDGHQ